MMSWYSISCVTFFIPKSAKGSKVGVDVDGVRVAGEAVEGGLVGGRDESGRQFGSNFKIGK